MKAAKTVFSNSLSFISWSSAACLNALTKSGGILNCIGTSSAEGTTPRWRVAVNERTLPLVVRRGGRELIGLGAFPGYRIQPNCECRECVARESDSGG